MSKARAFSRARVFCALSASRVLTCYSHAARDAPAQVTKSLAPHIWSFLLLALSALTALPASAAPFPVGTWFGTGQPNDKSQMWVAYMMPNGDFRAEFRACLAGKAYDETDSGNWILEGDIEAISVIAVNGLFNPRVDIYKILYQDGKKQSYRYLKTGFVFNSRRVDDKFEMPSCESIS